MERREFLKAAAVVAAAAAPALPAASPATAAVRRRDSPAQADCALRAPKRILVLGGTRFLGPTIVRTALSHGHDVTMFNRGVSNPFLFSGVERRIGNRFPETSPGLAALENGRWDVVIDTCAQYPRLVEASARLLADRAEHYILMSSIGVYGDYRRGGITEESRVLENPPTFRELPDLYETDWQTYGWRKVLCERAAQKFFPGRCAVIRPGHLLGQELGGQNKSDGRWYWPARFHRDAVVGAPGDGRDPVQPVDIRDLANFLMLVAANKLSGTYNVVGPTIRFADFIETARNIVGSCSVIRWIGRERSRRILNVPYFTPFDALPGFATIANARAVRAGMKFRPIREAMAADWQFFLENMPRDYDFSANRTGLTPQEEASLIAL